MFLFNRRYSAHIQRVIPFVSSTGRQAQSLVVDSTKGEKRGVASLRCFYSCVSRDAKAFIFSPSLLRPSLSLSRYLACRESRGNSRSKVQVFEQSFPENVSASCFSRPSLLERAWSGSGVGNLRATDFAPRLPFGPIRKSKVARAYGADRDISIRYLDLRYSGRGKSESSFQRSICRIDNVLLFTRHLPAPNLSHLYCIYSYNFIYEKSKSS